MSWVWAAAVVLGFTGVLAALELPARAREAGRRGRACVAVMRDPERDDAAKETELRRQALRLFALFGLLAGGSLLALALPLGGVWLLDAAGVASFAEVLATLESLDFLLVVTVAGAGAYAGRRLLGAR